MSYQPSTSRFVTHAALGLVLASVLTLNVHIAETLGVLKGAEGWVRVGIWSIIVYAFIPYMEWAALLGHEKYQQYRNGVNHG